LGPSAKPSNVDNANGWKPTYQPHNCQFRFNGPAKKKEDSSSQGRGNISQDNDEYPRQLLRYHQQLGHKSFAKLQILVKEGALPKHLAKFQIPV
jgi:hypothetical protein